MCYVAEDYSKEILLSECSNDVDKSYELPDGNCITIGKERFQCPELLFRPMKGTVNLSTYFFNRYWTEYLHILELSFLSWKSLPLLLVLVLHRKILQQKPVIKSWHMSCRFQALQLFRLSNMRLWVFLVKGNLEKRCWRIQFVICCLREVFYPM